MQSTVNLNQQEIVALEVRNSGERAGFWGLFALEVVSAVVAIESIRLVLRTFDFDLMAEEYAVVVHRTNVFASVPLNGIVLWLGICTMMAFFFQLSFEVAQGIGRTLSPKAGKLLAGFRWGSAIGFSLCASYSALLEVLLSLAEDPRSSDGFGNYLPLILLVFSLCILYGIWLTCHHLRQRSFGDGKSHRVVTILQKAPLAQWVAIFICAASIPLLLILLIVVFCLGTLALAGFAMVLIALLLLAVVAPFCWVLVRACM